MKRRWWLACLMAAGSAVAQTADEVPSAAHDARHAQAPPVDPFRKAVVPPHEKRKRGVAPAFDRQWRAALALGDDDAAGADRALAQAIAHPEFPRLDPSEQRLLWSRAAWTAVRLRDLDRARALALKAVDAGSDDPDDVYLLAQLESRRDRPEAAAGYLRTLAQRWPEVLDNLDAGVILRIAHAAPDGSEIRLQVLDALLRSGWDNKGLGVGDLWYRLALEYHARGDLDGVRRAIARTTAPDALVRFRADKRFDDALDRADAHVDADAAARRRVDALRTLAAERPDSLEIRMELGSALLAVGRNAEAVALADEVLDAIAAAPADAPPYADPEFAAWILNNRAVAQRRLGKLYEAQADLFRGAAMAEEGGANVSQVLNLGRYLCQRGRAEEARATIARVGDGMSGYGRMMQASVEHCAAVQLRDARAARRALGYLRDHQADSQELWIRALVEGGHVDEAARALIAALSAPATRGDMLAWVQDYRRPAPLPGEADAYARWHALLARDDVRQAVERFGRIERYDFFDAYGT